MSTAAATLKDSERLEALRRTGLLRGIGSETFDCLTRVGSELVGAPIALLSVVGEEHVVVLSIHGAPEEWNRGRERAVADSLSPLPLAAGRPVVIDDLLENPGSEIAMVEELGLRSYAAVPIRIGGKHLVGALAAGDRRPREWTGREIEHLEELAVIAMREMDSRLEFHRAESMLQVAEARAEELLAEVTHFRALVEQSLVGISIIQDERFQYLNPRAAEIFGATQAELIGAKVLDVIAPADRPLVMQNLARRISGEVESIRYTFRGRRGDAEEVVVEAHGSRTEFRGRPAVIATLLDVTSRQSAEHALRESEERHRLVVQATNSAVWDWNLESGRIWWSEGSHLLLRYGAEELGDRVEWWFEKVHPEDRARVVNGIHAAINGTADSWSEEHRFLRGDGTYPTVLDCCYLKRDESGVVSRVVGSLQDVTDRKAAEEAQRFLARASKLLDESLEYRVGLARLARLIVPTLADYCLIDLVEERGTVSRAAVAHVDPGRESVLLRDARHSLDDDPELHPVVRVISEREPVLVSDCTEETLRTISHDEEHLAQLRDVGLCSFLIVPLIAHQRVLGAMTLASAESRRRFNPVDLMVAQDVAYRAALAIEHGQLYDQARKAIEARDEVLGVVSHDLRNPLNTISISAGLLADTADDRRSANLRTFEVINRAVQQMNRMIGDLLDLSSIEAQSFTISCAQHRVERLVEEAAGLLEPLAVQQSVELKWDVDESLPPLWLDSHQILRVLSNLVGNAIKFTPEGGEVRVQVQRQDERACFTISDTGPGVPREQLSHVFERYWQARQGDRRGAGLGLAIAKGIVEAHGGDIGVQSRPGAGATFYFTVPFRAEYGS